MSNIYINEPPTYGKVCMKTNVGDIDIELWARECPKACRNFVQLAMEGYFDNTIFHRVVKDFIVQGGDSTGSGLGGESIYNNEPFKDEFHSRLKFNRRGLVGLANAGKDDNKSQFFFTMAATPELQNKHTLFGKVTGTTIFNMLKLQEGAVDHNERPEQPKRIISIEILKNPFDDIIPREIKETKKINENTIKIKSKSKATKDFKLLSFGEEAEEDEQDLNDAIEKIELKNKSLPGLIADKSNNERSNIEQTFKKTKRKIQIKNDNQDEEMEDRVDELYKKLDKKQKTDKYELNDDQDESSQDEYSEEKKKMEKARQEIEKLKKEVSRQRAIDKFEKIKEEQKQNNPILNEFNKSKEKYLNCNYTKTANREQQALELLAKFKSKLKDEKPVSDSNWLKHKLKVEENDDDEKIILAKDANLRNKEEWLDIHDPQNPLNKKRREIDAGIDDRKKSKKS